MRSRFVAAACVWAAITMVAALFTPVAAAQESTEVTQPWKQKLAESFEALSERADAPTDMCVSTFLNNEQIVGAKHTKMLVPASLMKLVTATVALEVIGADGVYTTEVFADSAAWGSVVGGTLHGDLYLRGGGDPVLSTPRYVSRYADPEPFTDITELADSVMEVLTSRGVTRIEGRVMGDESHFVDTERDYSEHYVTGEEDPVWKRDFVSTNLAGPLSALLLNDGFSSYRVSTSSAARRSRVRAPDPAQHAASVFDDLLEARGMVITGRPRSGLTPAEGQRTSLGTVDSPPLSVILGRMLNRSDNTIAEMIFKELGRRMGDSTRAGAAIAVGELLRDIPVEGVDQVVVADGSGLSSHNRLSCEAAVGLLLRAGPGSVLVDGLSVAGETGSLRTCWPSPPPAGQSSVNDVRAKTGTLNDVSALAGVTVADNGDVVTFAMIANDELLILRGACSLLRRAVINAAAHYTYGPPEGTPPTDRIVLADTGDEDTDDGEASDTGSGEGDGSGGDTGNGENPAPSRWMDVTGAAHADAIAQVVGAGIIEPCNSTEALFCPDEPVTRADMAIFLFKALSLDPDPLGRFADTIDHTYELQIAAIAGEGITFGCDREQTLFCPDDVVTRAQMASFLVRAFALPSDSSVTFADVEDNVHEAAIEAVAAAGITLGCDAEGSSFCPGETVTRAQMASFLARAIYPPTPADQ